MIQELYQKAMKFAGEKHSHQTVPGTESNYLLHISNVAMEILISNMILNDFDLNYTIQVGILHDTLEDTETTFEEISNLFGLEIARGVLALTKDKSIGIKRERMSDSLKRINAERKEIGIIKLADRITNLQEPPKNWSLEKVKNYYEESKLISVELKGKNQYLNDRLQSRIDNYLKYTNQEQD